MGRGREVPRGTCGRGIQRALGAAHSIPTSQSGSSLQTYLFVLWGSLIFFNTHLGLSITRVSACAQIVCGVSECMYVCLVAYGIPRYQFLAIYDYREGTSDCEEFCQCRSSAVFKIRGSS